MSTMRIHAAESHNSQTNRLQSTILVLNLSVCLHIIPFVWKFYCTVFMDLLN